MTDDYWGPPEDDTTERLRALLRRWVELLQIHPGGGVMYLSQDDMDLVTDTLKEVGE